MVTRTASERLPPAPSATALRFSKTRRVWASKPSTKVMVDGSSPIWPER